MLDFGLAKAFTEPQGADPSLSASPTLTKGTAIGTILGTASYMSPEQAKGKPVDTRTDVWAFLFIKERTTSEDPYYGLNRLIVVHNRFEELNARVPVE